ncbi:cytochrome P450 [Coniophora puteana RWD-64-598 SS2]|uniref:Cytochrome P450 n=1 Tax=Coniophora puteana (strain RWD-64-598) TaxID=741705 RepID=A0A5M3MTX8_CONPW|nr:cytochrome P450 [Coniophora puteana RWD-64-598 SS2]EIW82619.1 cytochrome P450 [Coniophora puteana RWD-64-598 SS2]
MSFIFKELPRFSVEPLLEVSSNSRALDAVVISFGVWLLLKVGCIARRCLVATSLPGPPRTNLLLGEGHFINESNDPAAIFESWEKKYGGIYSIPSTAWMNQIVLCDPKAVAHFYHYETTRYSRPEVNQPTVKASVVDAWSAILDASENNVIEVQTWMNHVSLGSIGIAGFSHNFGALYGKQCDVADIFDEFVEKQPLMVHKTALLLGLVFPFIIKLPTGRMQLFRKLNAALGGAAKELVERMRQEELELQMSEEEVLSQIKLLLLAGYETTSISLSWILAELAQHKDVQEKLREELSQFVGKDPSYDQLTSGLPYLDAVVLETLRLHPAVTETARIAIEDDVIPVSDPIKDLHGNLVHHAIAKGTHVPDAKQFDPERWFNPKGLETRAKEIQGHKHLLTFIDGPRTCLGKAFAPAEFKAVLSTLVRNFAFDMWDADAKIKVARGLFSVRV